MLILSAALTLADIAYGAAYPAATVIDGPKISATGDANSGPKKCFVEYTLRSDASIPTIAQFYLDQGESEKAKLLGDTRDRFKEYRTIAFAEPHLMFVVLSRHAKTTQVKVSLKMPDGCRAPSKMSD